MDKEELAKKLDRPIYPTDRSISAKYYNKAQENNLVIVFGSSDDLMEFRGAIDDEIGCYEGCIAYITKGGLLENRCEEDDCPYFYAEKLKAQTIEAIWDEDGYSFIYKTDIPHATFDVLEDDEKYCRGIVFSMDDLN